MPRWIALGAFLGLAALMLVSGFGAVHMLEQMHLRENLVRHAFATRTRVFTNLVISVESCPSEIPRTASGEPDPAVAHLLDQMEAQINTGLLSYDGNHFDAERERLHRLGDLVGQQKKSWAAIFGLNSSERHREESVMIAERVMPVQRRMHDWASQVQVWNLERLHDDDGAVVAELAGMQSELGRILWVSLGSGLLLIAASLLYMVRMEKQARDRVAELSANGRELQLLSARLVDAQETERRSISRELHDQVGQSLGALLVDIGRLAANPSSCEPEVKAQLERMKSAAEQTMQTVRNIALLLRPSMLDDLGLEAALEWQGREVSRRSSIEVEVRCTGVSPSLPDGYKICIYRVAQEALNNADRHSGARNAQIIVEQSAAKISARIHDDGRGFDPSHTRGMGLLGMEERVKRLDGRFSVDSQPGRGATVSLELPLPPKASAAS